LAIGNDGSVFALASNGTLARWNNGQMRFLPFPGGFVRIAVAPDGKPWGVTTLGGVFRYDGSLWQPVQNIVAQDIAIGLNGSVIVSGTDEVLYRYNPFYNRFDRIFAVHEGDPAPAGSRIAVDPQGRPWTVTRDNVLWRCDRSPCERQPQPARDVAIGPEGSIFITDTDYRLRRFNGQTGEWDRVGVDAEMVAVGPGGKPWIVNAKSEVWSSALFPRDESQDIAVAASSSTSSATVLITTASGGSLFAYSLNMAFDLVPWPAGFTTGIAPNDWIPMAMNSAGKLVVVDAGPTFAFWNYDDIQKKLVKDTTVPSPASVLSGDVIRSFAIGKDGTYWITNDNPAPPKIWRRQGSLWVAVLGLDDCGGCGTPSAYSVAIGPDGAVYATSSGDNIYRYDPAQLKFVKFTNVTRPPNGGAAFITVDPSNGHFWAGEPATPLLYENVGGTWISRTDATITPPGACFFTAMPCVSASSNGNIYGMVDSGPSSLKLVHWNALLGKWEILPNSPSPNGSPVPTYIAAPDGRPWVFNGANLYRGR
jgi:hypothetical protein